jgi:hypothetical protein
VSDAPLTIWLRRDDSGHYYRTGLPDVPDAIEYIRKDVSDAWLAEAGRREDVIRSWNEAPYRAPPIGEALTRLPDKPSE